MKKICSKKFLQRAITVESERNLSPTIFTLEKICWFFEHIEFEKSEEGKKIIVEAKKITNRNGTEIQNIAQPTANRMIRIKIDGGLIHLNFDSKRCDWVFYNFNFEEFYFVELKGSSIDMSEPFEQIKRTIEIFRSRNLAVDKYKVFGIIVGGKDSLEKNTKITKTKNLREDFQAIGKDLLTAKKCGKLFSPYRTRDDFIEYPS
jgi:hypothetical protein